MIGAFKVKSEDGSQEYTVRDFSGSWECDCIAGQMGKMCKHVRLCKNRQEDMQPADSMVTVRGARAMLDAPLELDADVQLLIHGTVVEVRKRPNYDGSVDMTYVVEAKMVESIKKEI